MSLTTINTTNIFKKEETGNVRKVQEDSHDMAAMTPNGDVFVVCDGMGGHVGGKRASEIAVEKIIEHLKKEKYSDPVSALDSALQYANVQILGYANNHPELKGMGTTACILLLCDDEAYIAHVGDSRIYLYLGKEKRLHRITKDHSYVQTLVDAGNITDEEAESHPNKNRILKALGIKSELEPTINTSPILPKNGDIFLICSDGLNGMISDSTISDVLSNNDTIKQKGDMLIYLAMKNGGLDNITVELIQISNSPHKKSIYKHCDFNPKTTSKSKTGIKWKLPKGILKWIMRAIVILAICFGGLYWYWYSQKKYALQRERVEFIEAFKGLKTGISLEWEKYTDDELIPEIEKRIIKPHSDINKLEEELKQLEPNTIPLVEVKEEELKKSKTEWEAYNNVIQSLDEIKAKYKQKRDSLIQKPVLFFMKRNNNENNNNRKK
ncbi:MAG: Stp1/IreP family PP2C-type Ser/Thr phosphatase [Bacteroidales bacterium]|jgi:serine/threonine protein phosphatase PrpC|nr:Stp1/IreP family PP2C-type Ser/Thr phosphatase [Bacteroidales bacterium]